MGNPDKTVPADLRNDISQRLSKACCSLLSLWEPTSALVCTLYMFLVKIVAPINTFCCRLLRGKGFREKNRYLSLFTNSKSALNLQAFFGYCLHLKFDFLMLTESKHNRIKMRVSKSQLKIF